MIHCTLEQNIKLRNIGDRLQIQIGVAILCYLLQIAAFVIQCKTTTL